MASPLPIIKARDTYPKGIFVSLLVGSIPAGIIEYAIGNLFGGAFGAGIAVGTLIIVSGKAWKLGFKTSIDIGWVGVHQFGGNVTGRLYGPGEPYEILGIDKYTPVNMKEQPTTIPRYDEEAADNSKVYILAFFSVKVHDPFKTFTVHHHTELLTTSFKSSVKSFVNVWKSSIYVKDQAQFLSLFLTLPPNNTEEGRLAHADFRYQLEILAARLQDPEPFLLPRGIDAIMQSAGSFVEDAERFGLTVVEARITGADIDQAITQSIDDKIAEINRMAKFQIQHEQRMRMAKDFMSEDTKDRMTMRDAVNLADRAMGLGVTTNINEIDLRDVNMIAELLKGVAEPTAKAFQAWAESRARK